MSEDGKYYGFRDGLPTKPDVDALIEKWPFCDMKVGQIFGYEEIGQIIKVFWRPKQTNSRFMSITSQWRKRAQEKGWTIDSQAGSHFYVASAAQILSGTYPVLTSNEKRSKRHRIKLASAKYENEQQQSAILHHSRILAVQQRESRKAKMNLVPNKTPSETFSRMPHKKEETA